ncbi:MAG: glycoside hydrolase family 3 N-terminal domain-containing protein [Propionicimonas sp.]|uniref:beta-xylosidase/alpha-l-arabinosidase n=1 Tax=Propionicimonas sp. TaxID=1955623 RepID=UPI002B219DCB|nr:glycoside hydrolase family 3 N-terminal domain-containing protein [Propionicimonas sp.]MEA4945423.1 glycoside hydrolase family 3 N-terminal domain-containing protein [Propionicimonas sp.]
MPVTRLTGPWHDTTLPLAQRVDALIAELTVAEKVAQLYGIWVGASADGEDVAPNQNEMSDPIDLDVLLPRGLGQLTRPFGTAPVDPAVGAVSLLRTQRRIMAESRFGLPAIAHEECLAGFAAWQATAYPVPLSWGATFDPDLVGRMGERIGADLASLGIHQGLAPVLDVVRDLRWGRVEETIGEDPYLVGRVASAYIGGIESAGVIATLKHFIGYSASKAGRNLAPVSLGTREFHDVLAVPFEMALRTSGVRSVMNSYTDIDGVPVAADERLLTGLLRDTWGFDGTVVSDYFAIGFLHTLHATAEDFLSAAELALRAGIDVELPSVKAFNDDLVAAVEEGRIDGGLIDRALRRVLLQKAAFGMLDPDYSPVPPVLAGADLDDLDGLRGSVALDPPGNRALARQLAEQAVVLVSNDGLLPLAAARRIAVIGPNAADPYAVLGCYSFPSHVGVRHPEVPLGLELPTLVEAMAAEFPEAVVEYVAGTTVDGGETDFEAALAAARGADVVVLALGDRAGLFGRGTSGEGCDAPDLALPGAQQQLLEAVLATGTPTVVTLLAGRPYALGEAGSRASALLAAFFLGEEGTAAIAGVLSGRVNPSGRLPVSLPAHAGSQPSTYLAAPLARRSGVSTIDPTPAYGFGHGLSYTAFAWTDAQANAGRVATDQPVTVSIRIANTGDRAGAEVVQLYLHDPFASVVRPVQRLIGFTRVPLEPGQAARVSFSVHPDLTSFTGVSGTRIVEPGRIEFGFARSSSDIVATLPIDLTGPVRQVDHTRVLHPEVRVEPA